MDIITGEEVELGSVLHKSTGGHLEDDIFQWSFFVQYIC